MEPTPIPDLTKLRPRPSDPLLQEHRSIADYWRRLAGEIAGSLGDPRISGLYFDAIGTVVAARGADGHAYVYGRPTATPPGWLWYANRGAAAELDRHSQWAEWNLGTYLGKAPPAPVGDMPERVARGIRDAKRRGEAELQRRGEA